MRDLGVVTSCSGDWTLATVLPIFSAVLGKSKDIYILIHNKYSISIIVITSKDVTIEDRKLMRGQIADVIRKGDLLMPDLESRLRDTLEEIGVKPSDGEDTVS